MNLEGSWEFFSLTKERPFEPTTLQAVIFLFMLFGAAAALAAAANRSQARVPKAEEWEGSGSVMASLSQCTSRPLVM